MKKLEVRSKIGESNGGITKKETGKEKYGVRDYFHPHISQKALIKLRHCECGQINFSRDKNTKFAIQQQIFNIKSKNRSNTEQQQKTGYI